MKKALIFFTILLASLTFSQEFILTENNYKLKDDNSKNYVVIDFQGKTKSELFSSIKEYITDEYKESLDKNYKELENEQIIFDALSQSSRTIFINKKGSNIWKVLNRYEINFKDEKIIIRPTFLNLANTDSIGRGIAYDIGWTDVKLKVSEKILTLSAELKEGMNKKYEGSKD